jgi:hypothetical protein
MTEQLGGWLIVGACAAIAGVIWTRKPRATFEAPCYHCGEMLTLDLPFTQGTLRGLAARECKCGGHVGNSRPPWCVVRADGGDILQDLSGES